MRQLYPYQERGAKRLLTQDAGGALWFEPGLGKTITAIAAAQRVGSKRVLVVCPVSAIGVWEDELRQEGIIPQTPEGTRTEKAKHIKALRKDIKGSWVILNYEALLERTLEESVKRWDPSLVILDESHRIKTVTAKRTRATHRICDGRRTFLLSGTPITRNLLDLYSQYKAIDPSIWDGKTWTKFKHKYARYGGYLGKEVVGYQNVSELKRRIKPYSMVLRKEDAIDLPPRTDQTIPVRLTVAETEQYQELANGGLWEGEPVNNPLERALRLQQLVGGFKIKATIGTVEELLEADQKVVLFYRFRDEGKQIESSPLRNHIVAHLHGGVPATERTKMIKRFQTTEGPAVFLSQISAGSMAITLTAASEVVYHSLTWALEDYLQSRDRVYRIGQERPVTYRHMVATGHEYQKTIDRLVLTALKEKTDVAAMITADPSLIRV